MNKRALDFALLSRTHLKYRSLFWLPIFAFSSASISMC